MLLSARPIILTRRKDEMTHRMHQVAGSNGFVKASAIALTSAIALVTSTAQAADQALLDLLLSNGAIDPAQYDELLSKEALEEADVVNIGFANGSGLNVK